MNANTLKTSLRTLILLAAITMVAQGAAAADATGASDGDGYTAIGAGIALGLAAIGAGRGVGAAFVAARVVRSGLSFFGVSAAHAPG